ncbi:hypothetical protein TGMAS_202065 [Toxoplasma gondii MAS]|uniref:Uncharacterized protein n=1 Tax=Toxoplasma gondii MAS TaxID=943118 RepID=A0A086QGA1_TOXGO|nr:hypothetical protein TGMAS_202065 [Toxoplasma gondii MAS]
MKECVMNGVVKVMRVTSFQTLEKYSDAFSVKAVVWRDSWRNACTHRHQVMLSSMILHDQTNDLDMKHYCCCMSITCARQANTEENLTFAVLARLSSLHSLSAHSSSCECTSCNRFATGATCFMWNIAFYSGICKLLFGTTCMLISARGAASCLCFCLLRISSQQAARHDTKSLITLL